jgi:hypothetical protein
MTTAYWPVCVAGTIAAWAALHRSAEPAEHTRATPPSRLASSSWTTLVTTERRRSDITSLLASLGCLLVRRRSLAKSRSSEFEQRCLQLAALVVADVPRWLLLAGAYAASPPAVYILARHFSPRLRSRGVGRSISVNVPAPTAGSFDQLVAQRVVHPELLTPVFGGCATSLKSR